MEKIALDVPAIIDVVYGAVLNGKISKKEYRTAINGLRIIKRVVT